MHAGAQGIHQPQHLNGFQVFLGVVRGFFHQKAILRQLLKAQGGKLIDVGALVEWLGSERSLANICPEEFDFWNDFNLPKGKTDVYQGLDRLTAEAEAAVLPLHPFKVEGDVQFGFNRTGYGYLVYLINNAGVKKYGDTLEQIAPGGSDVVITAKDGSAHKVTVGYGSLKVLKFLEKENRWEECL